MTAESHVLYIQSDQLLKSESMMTIEEKRPRNGRVGESNIFGGEES